MEYLVSVNFSVPSDVPLTEVEVRYLLVEKIRALACRLQENKKAEFPWEIYQEIDERESDLPDGQRDMDR